MFFFFSHFQGVALLPPLNYFNSSIASPDDGVTDVLNTHCATVTLLGVQGLVGHKSSCVMR